MNIDEALLCLNDRLGQEVTAWIEVIHEQPLLIATGILENWGRETTPEAVRENPQRFDLYGHYSLADARFDLSDAPVESVSDRPDGKGLTFRFAGGVRLIVTWLPMPEEGMV